MGDMWVREHFASVSTRQQEEDGVLSQSSPDFGPVT